MSTVKAYAEKILRRLRPDAGERARPQGAVQDTARQRMEYARAVFSNGGLPSNFTVTIGVAPCNYSCRFCPQSVSKPRKALWLDLGLLRKCLSEMPEENVLLNVSSFSETIAAPNLVPCIRLMKEVRPKLGVVMATNGSLFRENVISDLIDAGLDHYSYSFDAPTRETYRTLIQVDNFDKAWRNLEQVVEMRNRKRSPMKITTHIMHFKGVEDRFEQFKAQWQDKLDGVVLRRVGNWGGADELSLTRKLEELGFVSAHETPAQRYPCNSIFMHFQLQPDGHYMPCLGTTPDYASNPKYSLGHAADTTWSQAWARLGEMRDAHLRGEWEKIEACRSCNIWSMWDETWLYDPKPGPRGHVYHLEGVEHAL